MAKKLDLGAYMTGTPQTQHTHSKYTRYFENEGGELPEITPPEPVTEAAGESVPEQKDKRINMAFSDKNYSVIMEETERLGITCVYMINTLVTVMERTDVEEYLSRLPIRRTKDNIPRRKGSPMKRINLKFTSAAYTAASAGAEATNMTITQYVNTVIEVYAQGMHS